MPEEQQPLKRAEGQAKVSGPKTHQGVEGLEEAGAKGQVAGLDDADLQAAASAAETLRGLHQRQRPGVAQRRPLRGLRGGRPPASIDRKDRQASAKTWIPIELQRLRQRPCVAQRRPLQGVCRGRPPATTTTATSLLKRSRRAQIKRGLILPEPARQAQGVHAIKPTSVR